jgi:hypothetical protein
MPSTGRAAVCASWLLLAAARAAGAAPIVFENQVSCATTNGSADLVSHGFYVSHYPGNNLSQVALSFRAGGGSTGYRSLVLTARRGSYDGPSVGAPQIATARLSDQEFTLVVFDFGGAPVTPGDTLTFAIEAVQFTGKTGPTSYQVGTGFCPGLVQTEGTTAPLDVARGFRVSVIISQRKVTTSCVPSDTVMCIDHQVAGDRRFRATIAYQTGQSGGMAGDGQEIPLADKGVARGGLFWFFTPDNPEVVLKILDGCAVNDRFWVYFSAATNVGFTLTVRDTKSGTEKVYTNADLHAAQPTQDVNAFSCT